MNLSATQLDLIRYGAGPTIALIALITSWRTNRRNRITETWKRAADAEAEIRQIRLSIRMVRTLELDAHLPEQVPLLDTDSGSVLLPSSYRQHVQVSARLASHDHERPLGELLWPVVTIFNDTDSTLIGANVSWYGRGRHARSPRQDLEPLPAGSSRALPLLISMDEPAWLMDVIHSDKKHYFPSAARAVVSLGDTQNRRWWRISGSAIAGPGLFTDSQTTLAFWLDNSFLWWFGNQYGKHFSPERRYIRNRSRRLPLGFLTVERLVRRFQGKTCEVRDCSASDDALERSRFVDTCQGEQVWLCERHFHMWVVGGRVVAQYQEIGARNRLSRKASHIWSDARTDSGAYVLKSLQSLPGKDD